MYGYPGADPGFFLGGGALVYCSTSTPINHIVFFGGGNTSCIRKLQVISGGGRGVHPLHPPPRSTPDTIGRKLMLVTIGTYSQTRSSVPVANELMNSFTEK